MAMKVEYTNFVYYIMINVGLTNVLLNQLKVFSVEDLNEDTKPHFRSLKLKDTKGFKNEHELIENRIGKQLIDTSKICAHHPDTLGVGYKMKTRCQHPKHAEKPKQKKGPPTRVAYLYLCESISGEYGVVFPVGGVLCTTHYKEGKVGKDVSARN